MPAKRYMAETVTEAIDRALAEARDELLNTHDPEQIETLHTRIDVLLDQRHALTG